MELSNKIARNSDDEDDLESLRLAALQTLKKTTSNVNKYQPPQINNKFNGSPHVKRNRNFHSVPGRGGRNGQFNGRVRNTNLISITVQPSENPVQNNFKDTSTAPKLSLPQDRYCGKGEEESKEKTSKFNRYDNSDESDSEEESESENSVSESPGKLERAGSLEALMQELEYEISGESKPKEKKVAKNKKKKMKRQNSENESLELELKVEENILDEKNDVKEVEVPKTDKKHHTEQNKNSKVDEVPGKKVIKLGDCFPERRMVKDESLKGNRRHRSRSPIYRKTSPLNGYRRPPPKDFHRNHYPPSNMSSYQPPFVPFHQPFQNAPFPNYYPQVPPPAYPHRPLSPLNLNTDALSTITMAPLSPRSAAFVLQNREIIERRKKSPKRSYSRSPSPPRFKKSPRSPSPRRYTRSASPKKGSPARRAPTRRMTPPRKRDSVDRKLSPKGRKSPPKLSVRERLGQRPQKEDETKRKRTPSPEISNKVSKLEVVNKVVKPEVVVKPDEVKESDPILEARKRKFQDQTITAKEGIIRLKPKVDEKVFHEEKPESTTQAEPESEPTPETDVQDDDLLQLDTVETIDDIFSDEESDDENEGRFKSSTTNNRNVSVLPFSQLVNGPNRDSKKTKPLEDRTKKDRRLDRHERKRTENKRGTVKDSNSKSRKESDIKKSIKDRISFKSERRVEEKVRVTSPIENKKIEIKIRNPAKYETTNNIENENIKRESKSRKVAVANVPKEAEVLAMEEKTEKVFLDDDDVKKTEGDLRAQLSRKRAERQHKLPVAEDVPSRLLQNALEGAVFKKCTKKSKRKEKDSAPKENEPVEYFKPCKEFQIKTINCNSTSEKRRVSLLYSDHRKVVGDKDKLPIHLRLGLTNDSDIFLETKKKKKNKSRTIEQVLCFAYIMVTILTFLCKRLNECMLAKSVNRENLSKCNFRFYIAMKMDRIDNGNFIEGVSVEWV